MTDSAVLNPVSTDPTDVVSQRRGKNIAIIGLIVQLVLAGVLLVVWMMTHSLSAMTLCWMMASGGLLWLMAAILFYTRQLRCQETLELQQIARQSDAGSIFEQNDISLQPAAKRVAFIHRWVVPIFSLLMAVYLVGVGLLLVQSTWGTDAQHMPIMQSAGTLLTLSIFLSMGVGFGAFLFSRYATGLGSQVSYRPLRATGSYLLVCVLGTLLVAAGLFLAHRDYFAFDRYFALIMPFAVFIFAAETVLNFVLDIYRPRVAGQEQRLAYDSRLFNLVAEPGRVGHGVAEAINYQFGFEVSKTWFYQLLSRALLPLVVVAVLIMIGMTSILVVPEGEEVVVVQLGRVQEQTLKPGLQFKAPWPFATAQRFKTSEIKEILLGAGGARSAEDIEKNFVTSPLGRKEVQLWTQEHGTRKEEDFLVAVPASRDNPAAVNVIKLVTSVQYRIEEPLKFAYRYDDASKMLECVAYQQMVRYLASATLLEEDNKDKSRPQAIMTTGRKAAADALREKIQAEVAALDLGVKIVNVDFQAVHPPASAAEAFQKVLEAERTRDVKRYEAQKKANHILAQVAGTPSAALRLALAVEKYQDLDSISRAEGVERGRRVESALKRARDGMAKLQEDIARDQLSGKFSDVSGAAPATQASPLEIPAANESAGGMDDKVQLREDYQQYIALLQTLQGAERMDMPKVVADAAKQANDLFAKAQGDPARLLAEATASRWKQSLSERARAETFERELSAFEAAPRIYVLDRWLDVMDQVLPGIPKQIIAAPRSQYEIRLDHSQNSQPMQGALEDLGKP